MRYIITSIAALVVLSTSSCVKTYNCVCTIETHSGGKIDKETTSTELNMLRKKDAEDDCNMGDQNAVENGYGFVKACELQ